jgi:hypothetical protein
MSGAGIASHAAPPHDDGMTPTMRGFERMVDGVAADLFRASPLPAQTPGAMIARSATVQTAPHPENPVLAALLAPIVRNPATPLSLVGGLETHPSLYAALIAHGVPTTVAQGAQMLWQEAWLGNGRFGAGPVWVRWGFGSAAELVDLLSRRGVDISQIQTLLAAPRLPPNAAGSVELAETASEAAALGLIQPDGKLGGLGAGGLAALNPDGTLPVWANGMLIYRCNDGTQGRLAMKAPMMREHDADGPGIRATTVLAGRRPIIALTWSGALARVMEGAEGAAILAAIGTAAGRAMSGGAMRPFGTAVPLDAGALLSGSLTSPGRDAAFTGPDADATGSPTVWLALRPRWQDGPPPDLLTSSLGNHIAYREVKRMTLDLCDPHRVINQDDAVVALVAADTIGVDAARRRAALLLQAARHATNPLDLLRPGEGLRGRHGAPIWLRCIGIEKPESLGPIPLAGDLPRFEVIRGIDGAWVVGHRANGIGPGWRTRYPEGAIDEAAFWLDLCYALPGSAATLDRNVLRRFNTARAAAESALRHPGLGGVRAAEAWSALALDIGLALAAPPGQQEMVIGDSLLAALGRHRPEAKTTDSGTAVRQNLPNLMPPDAFLRDVEADPDRAIHGLIGHGRALLASLRTHGLGAWTRLDGISLALALDVFLTSG